MAILPGLYSLRFLFSFSLLIFSATTSVEKAEACSSEFVYLFTHVSLFSPKARNVLIKGITRTILLFLLYLSVVITHAQYHNF